MFAGVNQTLNIIINSDNQRIPEDTKLHLSHGDGITISGSGVKDGVLSIPSSQETSQIVKLPITVLCDDSKAESDIIEHKV